MKSNVSAGVNSDIRSSTAMLYWTADFVFNLWPSEHKALHWLLSSN